MHPTLVILILALAATMFVTMCAGTCSSCDQPSTREDYSVSAAIRSPYTTVSVGKEFEKLEPNWYYGEDGKIHLVPKTVVPSQ